MASIKSHSHLLTEKTTGRRFRRKFNKPKETAAQKFMMKRVSALLTRRMKTTQALKYFDFITAGTVSTVGAVYPLFNIPFSSSPTSNTRLTMTPFILKMDVRCQMLGAFGGILLADVYNTFRLMFGLASSPYADLNNVSHFTNINQHVPVRDSFKIIRDYTEHLPNVFSGQAAAGAPGADTPSGAWILETIPVRKRVRFNTENSASDVGGMPFVYFVTDSAVSPYPTVALNVRTWFTEQL